MIEFKSQKPKLSISLDGAVEVTFTAPRAKLEALTNLADKVEKLEEHIEQGGLYYTLAEGFNEQAQLDNWELHDYGKGKTLYGWHISDLKIYDKPRELSEFGKVGFGHEVPLKRPPQSWMYIEDLGEDK